jgi:flagellar M-ring protein FliF
VDELEPEDVSIIDADSARSLGLHHDGQDDDTDGVDASLMQRLVATLEPVVGTDKIRASVNVDRNRGSSEESQEKYDPAVSALLSDQKTEDSAGGAAISAGVPGTSSNVPAANKPKTPAAPPQGTVQSSKTESAQYGVNKTIVRTMTPAGAIERVTAAILVDDAMVKNTQGGKTTFTRRKRTPDEMNKIREIAEAVIGFDAKRGDSISVENMAFDANALEADIPAPVWTDKVHKAVTDYSSLLRPVSLLVLFLLAYMFVLRPIQKQALGAGQANASGKLPLPAGSGPERLMPGVPEVIDHTRRAAQLKEQTVELVRQKPVNTARAVQAWLREEPS